MFMYVHVHVLSMTISAVYRVLDELKYKQYHSQMDRYLQLFHHRPVAAALYKKVGIGYPISCHNIYMNVPVLSGGAPCYEVAI